MSISWPARKAPVADTVLAAADEPIAGAIGFESTVIPVTAHRQPNRRRPRLSAAEHLRRVRSEIEARLDTICPKHAEFIRSIRRFASSRLSATDHNVIGVVSAVRGEGRTTVALGIAAALSEMFQSVAYVEADSGDSTLREDVSEAPLAGLCEWLNSDSNKPPAIYETDLRQLHVLPYGATQVRLTPLESVGKMRTLFRRLRSSFDVVVVDMPALLVNEGTPALIKELDNIVLVVGANQSSSAQVEDAVKLCGYIPVSGIFLNKLAHSTPGWVLSLMSPKHSPQ
jgi:Mrp family chromosome partitioning ATPase